MEQAVIEEGKTMAIIAYCTLIGLIYAWYKNKDENNAFVKFHIGQSVRVLILGIALSIVMQILITVTGIGFLGYLGYIPFVLWILGIMNAMNLKEEPLPIIGTIGG